MEQRVSSGMFVKHLLEREASSCLCQSQNVMQLQTVYFWSKSPLSENPKSFGRKDNDLLYTIVKIMRFDKPYESYVNTLQQMHMNVLHLPTLFKTCVCTSSEAADGVTSAIKLRRLGSAGRRLLTPVWMLLCLFKIPGCENLLLQISQLYGFSPV